MKKAVITGATGMIGSALARLLLRENAEVIAVVHPGSRKMGNLPAGVRKVFCDAGEYSSLPDRISAKGAVWFHFAWRKPFGAGRMDEETQFRNVTDTMEAVQAAGKLGCTAFLGAGSQAEFGPKEEPLSDRLSKNPVTAYGKAKLEAGRKAAELCRKLSMGFCWGRILSCYGPGDNPYTLVMSAVEGMLRGEHMSFTRGDQIWDYLYAEDAARAFRDMAERGQNGTFYTIGSGITNHLSADIREIWKSVVEEKERLSGTPEQLVSLGFSRETPEPGLGERPYLPDQVMHLEADISDLTRDTGWRPAISFEEGIRKTVAWVVEEKKGKEET